MRLSTRMKSGGQVKEIAEDLSAVLARDALRVELHPIDGAVTVSDGHDETVVGFGAHFEFGRHGRALDDERMIARGLERPVEPAKDPTRVVGDAGHLAVAVKRE